MRKKINAHILVLPPYLSTSWKNVNSIHVNKENTLVVEMKGGKQVEIPNLDPYAIEEIFNAHALYLENENTESPTSFNPKKEELSFGFPLKIGLGGLDTLGGIMQHNMDQANSPNLPKEMINKIISVAKMLGISDLENIPKPEPHCNCPYCQVAKALHTAAGGHEENLDEDVAEEELKFRDWDIEQTGENMYEVRNPLDRKEQYNVFLGQPIGCTCGQKNCEHIKAVLNS